MRRLLVVLLLLGAPSTAAAASFTFTVNTASPITAPGITLSGDDQTKTFTMSYTVAYTGGQNTAGWNVQAASTTLTSGANTLPAMKVTGVTNANCTGGGCVNPTNSITWPVTLSTTSTRIFNAAATTGQGTVVLTATYQVSYPANALPGTYSATVTLTGATGP
jgi:hypothetical protein